MSSNILSAEHIVVSSVADPDPVSGAFLTSGSGIREGKKIWIRDPDEHFLGKTLKFFVAYPDQWFVVFLIQDPG